MTQTPIPYVFMRGGTSRGPYFRRADLPENLETLAQVLISVVGSGHALNIDGIGGGAAVTTKVAMLSKSQDDWADIDYFFAQVSVTDQLVDFKPTCGTLLSGVGPAAIELGLFTPHGDQTEIRIRAVNTGAMITANLQTPQDKITYDGGASIAGVLGQAAPIALKFMGVVGSSTGAFLPTGQLRDNIDGIDVTCMDVAMPMVIARASDFGLTGHESVAELDANANFFTKMEGLRRKAGLLMNMGDVAQSVTPKFGLLPPAADKGDIAARYLCRGIPTPAWRLQGRSALHLAPLPPARWPMGCLPALMAAAQR